MQNILSRDWDGTGKKTQGVGGRGREVCVEQQVSELIRTLRKKGWTTSTIAKHLATTGIRASLRTIQRHCRCAVVEKKKERKPRKVTSQVMEIIDSILRTDDELSARKVKELLQSRHNITIGLHSVRKAVRNLGWNFGKPRFVPMTRGKNKDLRVIQAQEWKAADSSKQKVSKPAFKVRGSTGYQHRQSRRI
uniref:Transposase Tc1-like domain-containing protein n=2 Tax=Knipowitschia caucasica TaxID=637954 RepID=A0AAV2MIL4_KNICA